MATYMNPAAAYGRCVRTMGKHQSPSKIYDCVVSQRPASASDRWMREASRLSYSSLGGAHRRGGFCIATQVGYLGCDFRTRQAAQKVLSREVREAAALCRRSKKRCSVIGSARKGSVEIRIGGRQGYHLWQRYVITQDRS